MLPATGRGACHPCLLVVGGRQAMRAGYCALALHGFAKFVALLEHRAIYLARADRLGDTFEGAAGITDRRPQWDAFYLDFFRHAVSTVPGQEEPPSTMHVEQEAARLLREFSTIGERDRRRTFVSCWHANTGESEALWRLYCPPPMMGVAIHTNARLLIDALGDDPQVKLGRVQYVDFSVRRSQASMIVSIGNGNR
jgi:hypothetical protein